MKEIEDESYKNKSDKLGATATRTPHATAPPSSQRARRQPTATQPLGGAPLFGLRGRVKAEAPRERCFTTYFISTILTQINFTYAHQTESDWEDLLRSRVSDPRTVFARQRRAQQVGPCGPARSTSGAKKPRE